MRRIGIIPDEADARRLADYLLTLDITTRLDPTAGGWGVWVHREERVEQARRELEQFVRDPSEPKYEDVERAAQAVRRQAEREQKQHVKNTIHLRDRWHGWPGGRCPLTLGLIGVCVAVAFWTNFGRRYTPILSWLLVTDPRPLLAPDSPAPPSPWEVVLAGLRHGEVWRLVTPISLHFSATHLLFNMLMLYQLGGLIERRRGTLALGLLILATAIPSNLGQYVYTHHPVFGGMSGVVYGLFGYLWMKSVYDPTSGFSLPMSTVQIMLLWLVLCMTGMLGSIANAAHVVGLAAGLLIGYAPHGLAGLRR